MTKIKKCVGVVIFAMLLCLPPQRFLHLRINRGNRYGKESERCSEKAGRLGLNHDWARAIMSIFWYMMA